MGNTIKMNMKMPIYQKQPNVTKSGKIKIAVSGALGMIIGTATSFVVNATLIEISLNKFFSLVFFSSFFSAFLTNFIVFRNFIRGPGHFDNLSYPYQQVRNSSKPQKIPVLFLSDDHNFWHSELPS